MRYSPSNHVRVGDLFQVCRLLLITSSSRDRTSVNYFRAELVVRSPSRLTDILSADGTLNKWLGYRFFHGDGVFMGLFSLEPSPHVIITR